MGDYIEVWSSEQTQEPFVAQEEFRQALEALMRQSEGDKAEDC